MEVQIKKSIKPKRKLVIRKEPPKQEQNTKQEQEQQEQAQQTQNTKQEQEQKEQDTKQEQDTKEKNTIESYIAQLSAQEKIVLNIAKEHLETSFDMEKSIGYIQWLKNKK
jgi:hypothetical protein